MKNNCVTALEVSINNEPVYIAGVGADGVLSANISRIKDDNKLSLGVGSFENELHSLWPRIKIEFGDIITLRFIKQDTCNAPQNTDVANKVPS